MNIGILFPEENKLLFTILTSTFSKQTGHLVGLALIVGGLGISSYRLQTDVATNLWSLRYLWQLTGHQLVGLTLAPAPQPLPVHHINGFTWQARAALEAGDVWQASRLLTPAIAQGNRDALRLQASLMAQQGDAQGANRIWAQLGDAESLLQAGQEHIRLGQTDKALAAYRAAYPVAPERTVLPLAHLLWSSDTQDENAEQLLVEALHSYPSSRYSFTWYRELGALYQHQKAWAKAAAIYEQIVRGAPDRYQDWIALGWVYYERGDGVEAALAQFEEAIAVAPDAGGGYHAIGSLLSREQRFAEADAWYQQAIEREPNQPWWWLSRANTLQQAGKLSSAIKVYMALQERFPQFAAGYYQAAWAFKESSNREQAVNAIEKALELIDIRDAEQKKINANYYLRAGQIYEWEGRLQKAADAYAQAQSLDPQQSDAQRALQRLYGN